MIRTFGLFAILMMMFAGSAMAQTGDGGDVGDTGHQENSKSIYDVLDVKEVVHDLGATNLGDQQVLKLKQVGNCFECEEFTRGSKVTYSCGLAVNHGLNRCNSKALYRALNVPEQKVSVYRNSRSVPDGTVKEVGGLSCLHAPSGYSCQFFR